MWQLAATLRALPIPWITDHREFKDHLTFTLDIYKEIHLLLPHKDSLSLLWIEFTHYRDDFSLKTFASREIILVLNLLRITLHLLHDAYQTTPMTRNKFLYTEMYINEAIDMLKDAHAIAVSETIDHLNLLSGCHLEFQKYLFHNKAR
jgi:hypothetical protein